MEPTVVGGFRGIASKKSSGRFVALEEAPSYAKCWGKGDGKCLHCTKGDPPQ